VDALRELLLIVHLAGMAVLLGGFVLTLMAGERRMVPAIFHGAEIQVVTGLVLWWADHLDHRHPPVPKLLTKLVIALVVTGLAHANRRRDPVPVGLFLGTFALACTNVGIAYGWK
jgi:uncharacterized membrane protein (UPF0136 family)